MKKGAEYQSEGQEGALFVVVLVALVVSVLWLDVREEGIWGAEEGNLGVHGKGEEEKWEELGPEIQEVEEKRDELAHEACQVGEKRGVVVYGKGEDAQLEARKVAHSWVEGRRDVAVHG